MTISGGRDNPFAAPEAGLGPFRGEIGRKAVRTGLARALLGTVLAGAGGAAASAMVGAVVGFCLWVTGVGFAYSWADWPAGGAIFGAVTGGTGGAIAGAQRATAAGQGPWDRRGFWPAVAALPGAALGFAGWFDQGVATAAVFGAFGAIGGAAGALTGGRVARTVAARTDPPRGGVAD